MKSEMVMMVRGDEDWFSSAAEFAANGDLQVAAQPATTPFHVAVYDINAAIESMRVDSILEQLNRKCFLDYKLGG